MSETVSNAVAQRDNSPTELVHQYLPDFAAVLPSHVPAPAFVRLAQGVLRRSEDLMLAARRDPGALMAALLDCARLGHEPGTPAYYLVPIKGVIEGWEGYRGVIERIYRAGAVQSVRAAVVRERDFYEYEEGLPRPVHRYPRFASAEERGPLVGVYAYAEMRGGGISRVVEMGRDEVMKHKAMSKGSDRPDSPWRKWEDSMWLKCGAAELEKWVPSSTEYRRQEARTAAEAQSVAQSPPGRRPAPAGSDVPQGDVLEGEVLDDEPADPQAWDDVEVAQPGGAER
jgi:recombination protein RecT